MRGCLPALAFATLIGASAVAAGKPAPAVSQAALDALVKRAGELDTDALVVMKDGRVILEKWYRGTPRRIESMSVTKSVVSLAVGRLLQTGKLKSVDERVSQWYPEWRQGRKRGITIRHLLTHTSGLQADRKTGTEINGNPDLVQLALCAELSDDPGTKFFYNNKATSLLAGLVQRISGRRLDLFLKEEVFVPLGITDFAWERDPAGNPWAMAGLQIRPVDLAKLGQLMADGGTWRGRQLLSPVWVKDATAPGRVNPAYGHLWWLVLDSSATIDDGVIAAWRKAGVNEKFIAALAPLTGRVYAREAFLAAIGKALAGQGGLETWHATTWRRGLPDGKAVDTRVVGFRGDGWQGQAIVVLPADRIVVVRMRVARDVASDEENTKYGFHELVKLARALTRP